MNRRCHHQKWRRSSSRCCCSAGGRGRSRTANGRLGGRTLRSLGTKGAGANFGRLMVGLVREEKHATFLPSQVTLWLQRGARRSERLFRARPSGGGATDVRVGPLAAQLSRQLAAEDGDVSWG